MIKQKTQKVTKKEPQLKSKAFKPDCTLVPAERLNTFSLEQNTVALEVKGQLL